MYLTRGLNDEENGIVVKATHEDNDAQLYWHLDQEYIGQTTDFHHFKINPDPGKHVLRLIDNNGNSEVLNFEIVSR